jgi:hypothetical protein
MASEPRTNDLGNESDDQRQARLYLLSGNIDTHKVALGVTGTLLTWAQGASDNWIALSVAASREAGDVDEAYQEFQLKYRVAQEKYSVVKSLLLAVLDDYQDNDEAAEQYGVMKETPRTIEAVYRGIEQIKAQHDIYTAAVDPRVIADSLVTALMAAANEFYPLWKFAVTQKKEARQAYDLKQAAFANDTKKLRLIFNMAVAVWGNNDPQLKELGFVPASEIWTPGGGVNPTIGIPEDLASEIIGADVRVFWHAVVGADEYQLSHTMHPPLFLQLFEGAETEFLHLGPDNGTHYYKVRAKVGEDYGEWSEQIEVEVTVAAPAPPINLILTIQPGNAVKATWQAALGEVPDSFSLYTATGPTGGIIPVMPATPLFDELITLTLTLTGNSPGSTVYVWVTAVKGGAESDPCGPVSIAIM